MKKSTRVLLQIALVIGFIFFGVSGLIALNALKPTMEKKTPPVAMPMARTITIETKTIQVPIEGQGIVHPLQEIQLVPQVGGKVIHVSPALVDGGQYQTDDILLKIDPADYRIAVTLAEARVKDAESKYILAEQESSVAKSDWYQLNPDTPPPPLVAKEPQLATAKAKLEAEKAELERARLNLSRTILKAPFDGRVSQKKVDIGQYIAPGQAVATLYSIEAAEIVLPMENDHLQWFHVPGFSPDTKTPPAFAVSSPKQPKTTASMASTNPETTVSVKSQIAGQQQIWEGRVVRAEGKVDELTRMINVVVRVNQPYSKRPPLAPGMFVTVEIKGKAIENAAIVPRSALHQDNIVWVINDDGRLEFRTVDVALRSREGVVIRSGLSDKDQVVVSPIKEVTNGMKVRNVPANNGGYGS